MHGSKNSDKLHIDPNQESTEESSDESLLCEYCNQYSTDPLALELNVLCDMQQLRI